ncbi:metallophosphoesterase [Acaryochloris sp. IP29b_bin.148]|uniref:metallophosphoesterase family protein n=1 Tax=Acaryochloris sp. IP29b_bin.148 TaxID=2969218 RepID=UPI00345255DF
MKVKTAQLCMVISLLVGGVGASLSLYQWQLQSSNPNLSGSQPAPAPSPLPPSPLPSSQPSQGEAIAPSGLFAPPRGDVRLVVISDLNSQYGSTSYAPEVTKAIALIPGWQPDLVLGGGDMVAGQSRSLNRAQVQAMWAAFDRSVAAPLRQAQLPLGFTIGNHDGSGALSPAGRYIFGQDRQMASAYWRQRPSNLPFVDRAQFPFYYTFAQDDIFYLVWDASTAKITPEQLAWVENSLASPAAQEAKLRIMIGHLPLYGIAVGRNKTGEYLHNAEQLRSLMERYRVHTYISGHQHAYYPGRRGQLQLLHSGALGGGPRQLVGSDRTPQKTLTVVDIDSAALSTTYTTYDMKTLQVIDHQQLPRQIAGQNGTVYRRDINPPN